jgi:hypothetical protein
MIQKDPMSYLNCISLFRRLTKPFLSDVKPKPADPLGTPSATPQAVHPGASVHDDAGGKGFEMEMGVHTVGGLFSPVSGANEGRPARRKPISAVDAAHYREVGNELVTQGQRLIQHANELTMYLERERYHDNDNDGSDDEDEDIGLSTSPRPDKDGKHAHMARAKPGKEAPAANIAELTATLRRLADLLEEKS